jgi:opacity protein-like surface antigen
MKKHSRARKVVAGMFAAAAGAAVIAASASAAAASTPADAQPSLTANVDGQKPVHIEVFAPERHSNAGIEGKGWFVDMELDFPGGPNGLAQSGFSGLQLTGPGAHNNVAPFPGSFSTGHDDRNPGLVVLTSTTNSTTPGFSGPGTNLANLFNITGVTNRSADETELWDTWLVGAPIAGQDVDTTLTVAEVADLNHNGIYDDAPDVVTDVNHDGQVDAKDLRAIGVASNVVTVAFHINGAPA